MNQQTMFRTLAMAALTAVPLAAQTPAPPAPAAAAAPSAVPAPAAVAAPSAWPTPPTPAAPAARAWSTTVDWAPFAEGRSGYVGVTQEQQGPQSGWLGIGISCERCSVSRSTMTFRNPPLVQWVDADGPAYRAGIRSGDTLLTVDGFDLTTTQGGRTFARIQPGQRVSLAYRRDGRARTVQLQAVLPPESRNDTEARAMMERYQMLQDSQLRTVRQQMMEASRELERVQRELEAGNRAAIDESRRRLLAAEAQLRELLGTEASRGRGVASFPPGFFGGQVAPRADVVMPSYTYSVPLRYSGRLGDLVNVEARGSGAVNTTEVGDTMIVVTAGDVVVRITRRPGVSALATTSLAGASARSLAPGIVLTDEGDAVIGLRGTLLRSDRAAPFGVGTAYQVTSVTRGSHADSLGLEVNDVILEVNGHGVTRGTSRVNVNGAATLTVMRSGERRVLSLNARR